MSDSSPLLVLLMTDVTTEIGFYTLNEERYFLTGRPYVETRCAACALPETNAALIGAGLEPADTMAEAALVLHMQMALNSDPQADTLLTYSERGKCDVCGKEA